MKLPKLCFLCHRNVPLKKPGFCEVCQKIDARHKIQRLALAGALYVSPDLTCADCKMRCDPRVFRYWHRPSTYTTGRLKTFRAFSVPLQPHLKEYLDQCDAICWNCYRERIKPSTDFRWRCYGCNASGNSKKRRGSLLYPTCYNCWWLRAYRQQRSHEEELLASVGLGGFFYRDLCDAYGSPYFI